MVWIVEDIVRRVRADIGPYRRREWRQFLAAIGLRYDFDELPPRCNAILCDGEVIFRNGLNESEISNAAFHEGGHHLTFTGDVRFWQSRLGGMQGDLTVARFERHANEFAARFPVTEGD